MSTDNIKRMTDIPFSDTLGLDVYLPDSSVHYGARPMIMWVHGGGFRPGNDKAQSYIVEFSTEFAKRDYVCVAPDYRLRDNPKDDMPGTIRDAVQDVDAALTWVREGADQFNIDPRTVYLAGGSAGGMTVVTLCYTRVCRLNGLINLWGSASPELTESFTFEERTPYFSVHGTADALVPYSNAPTLLQKLEAHGVDAELMTIPDAPHTPMVHKDEIIERIQLFLKRFEPA